MTDLSLVVHATADHLQDLPSCIFSAERARGQAQAAGHAVQSLIAVDPAESALLQWCQERLDATWDVVLLTEPQAGLADPTVWARCRGHFVAWTDGRDLWSGNWLRAALARASVHGGAWHPEMLLTYSGDHFAQEGRSFRLLSEREGSLDALLAADTLPTGFLCAHALLERLPFPRADALRGLGAVNHWWHCQAAAHGVLLGVVPETFHYRRLGWRELSTPPVHPRLRARYGAITVPPGSTA
jgi:hypothetical protein